MKLVVLGSGTSVPHPTRASPAFWLENDRGSVLLDVSSDAPHRMAQEGLDWPQLDAIWISHFHLDHLGGLAPLLFGMRWAPQTLERRKPFRIYGPQGLTEIVRRFNDANNYKLLEQKFPVELVEITPGSRFEILPGMSADTLSTPHTKESLAIRLIEDGDAGIVYSSDTGFSEKLIEFAEGARVLLLECSFRRNKPLQSHLELADAMRLAQSCEPRLLVLTHLYPEWDDIDIAAEAKTFWEGKTIGALDGLRLEI